MTMMNKISKIYKYITRFGLINGISILIKRIQGGNKEHIIFVPEINNKLHIRSNTSDWITFDQILLENEYNHSVLGNLKPKFILDAGANVGYGSIYFSNRFPDAKIVAIEPESSNYYQLKKNTHQLKNIECIQAALWFEEGNVKIKDLEAEKWAFQVEKIDSTDVKSEINAVTIPNILDKYKKDYIDILKIDIEGAEKYIFSDGFDSWLDKVGVLMIELHDWLEPGCAKAFYKAIAQYDFKQFSKGEYTFIVFAK